MSTEDRTVWHRLAVHAAGSVALWLAAVGGAWWYLHHATAEPYRGGLRTMTGPDSYGLPLLAFATAVGALLLVLNLGAAAVWVLRRRRKAS